MILDSTVTVVKDDGMHVLTTEVHPGDTILGTTYETLEAAAIAADDRSGPRRFDSGLSHTPTAAAPVVDSVPHPDRPDEAASKRAWWDYAIALGFGGDDYEHTSKAQLVQMYGNVDPKGQIGA